MSSIPARDMDGVPMEAFSTVWVKMEVDEDGTVEGIDDQLGPDDSCQEAEDNSQDAQEIQAMPRRSRRKPVAPRKAKNVEEKIFQCEYCDYKAIHKSTLKYHLMKHTNPDPVPCTMCSYTTTHAASLRRHMLSVHTDQNDPIIQALPDKKCNECDFTCKFSWKLFVHKRKHVEKSFQCEQCDFATARKSNFEKHCNTHKHKEGVTYECDKCPFVTKHEGHIARHLAVIHKEVCEGAKKCDYCEFSTKIRWRLNIHKKNSHQEKPIQCDFCDFITEYNCQYKLHKQQHISDMALVASGMKMPSGDSLVTYNPVKEKPVVDSSGDPSGNEKGFIVDTECEEVDWRSIEVGESPGHEKPFHCILCEYRSKFKASVQRHFQRNHTSARSKPYKCVNCEFSTKTRDQISLHNKRSKSIYQISCKACEFTTFYKCQMAEHQRIHWRFKCKLCDFICRVSYDLNTHYTVVHLGQGLKCRFCNFEAARKGSLLNHENTHTNKRFRCGLCDYSATRRNLLFNHMKRSHAGEKPKIIISDRKFELLKKVDEIRSESVESGKSDSKNIEKYRTFLRNVGIEKRDLKNNENYKSVLENVESGKSDLKNIESYRTVFENVESGKSDLKNTEGYSTVVEIDKSGPIKFENASVESQTQFQNEGSNGNEFEKQLKSVESVGSQELPQYVERQSDYEKKNLEFQSSTMFGDGPVRNGPGDVYEIEPRDNLFYPLQL